MHFFVLIKTRHGETHLHFFFVLRFLFDKVEPSGNAFCRLCIVGGGGLLDNSQSTSGLRLGFPPDRIKQLDISQLAANY